MLEYEVWSEGFVDRAVAGIPCRTVPLAGINAFPAGKEVKEFEGVSGGIGEVGIFFFPGRIGGDFLPADIP